MTEVKLDLLLSNGLDFYLSGRTKCVWKHTERIRGFHFVLISFCKMQLCPSDSIESDWHWPKCRGEMLIQLLRMNQNIRSLPRAQEIIGVSRDISPVHHSTRYVPQSQFGLEVHNVQLPKCHQFLPFFVIFIETVAPIHDSHQQTCSNPTSSYSWGSLKKLKATI